MTTATSDLTRVTILVEDPIESVPVDQIAKKLRKKLGLNVVDVLAERVDFD